MKWPHWLTGHIWSAWGDPYPDPGGWTDWQNGTIETWTHRRARVCADCGQQQQTQPADPLSSANYAAMRAQYGPHWSEKAAEGGEG